MRVVLWEQRLRATPRVASACSLALRVGVGPTVSAAAQAERKQLQWVLGRQLAGRLPQAVVSVAQLAYWRTRLREADSAGSGAAAVVCAQAS